jgi:ABC-type multidrug transport system fused ATPase/permease subunit
MTFVGGLLALYNRDLSPGLVGFSLVNATGFGDTILSLVRALNELEIGLNGYQRVMQYVTLPSEPAATKDGKPPPNWPTGGNVVVNNLSVKYNADGPMILSNISLSLKPKERVGICGRTGAGKTTFCLSLLRFTEKVSGSILIDGSDIDKINLEDLRDRVTIIPQDPVLFSGTVRSNLDPFGRLDDAALNYALRHSGLLDSETEYQIASSGYIRDGTVDTKGVVSLKITLDTPVTSNGDNFSQGIGVILIVMS